MNTDIRKGFLKERTMKERKAYEKDFYPPIPTDFTMKCARIYSGNSLDSLSLI